MPAASQIQTAAGVPLLQTAGTLAGVTATPFGTALASLVNKGTSVDLLITALEEKGWCAASPSPISSRSQATRQVSLRVALSQCPTYNPVLGSVPVITTMYQTFRRPAHLFADSALQRPDQSSPRPFGQRDRHHEFGAGFGLLQSRRSPCERRAPLSSCVTARASPSRACCNRTSSRISTSFPGSGSVPVLGTLFSSKSYQKNETDLVVIVTPHLVKPAAPGDHLGDALRSAAARQ